MNSNIVTRAPKLGEIPSVEAFLYSPQVKSVVLKSAEAKDVPVIGFLKLVVVGNTPYLFSGPEVHFASSFTGAFITPIIVNPSKR